MSTVGKNAGCVGTLVSLALLGFGGCAADDTDDQDAIGLSAIVEEAIDEARAQQQDPSAPIAISIGGPYCSDDPSNPASGLRECKYADGEGPSYLVAHTTDPVWIASMRRVRDGDNPNLFPLTVWFQTRSGEPDRGSEPEDAYAWLYPHELSDFPVDGVDGMLAFTPISTFCSAFLEPNDGSFTYTDFPTRILGMAFSDYGNGLAETPINIVPSDGEYWFWCSRPFTR